MIFGGFFHPKMKKAVMNFLNHYCFKQLFSGGIEPPTSAQELEIPLKTYIILSKVKSRKSLIFLTILLLPVKIRKPVFISVNHLSVLGAPGGYNHSVPSSSLSWPPLRFSFVTMITWFSYQINYIITCCRSDVDDFLTIFIVLYVTSLLVLQT